MGERGVLAQRCYDPHFPHHRSLICFASGAHTLPPRFVLAGASAPGSVEDPPRAGIALVNRRSNCRRVLTWASVGHLRFHHPVPLPRSATPAEPMLPSPLAVSPVLPLLQREQRLQRAIDFGATAGFSTAVYASRVMLPSPMQGSLPAGWLAFAGRSRALWIAVKGFRVSTSLPPFPDLS